MTLAVETRSPSALKDANTGKTVSPNWEGLAGSGADTSSFFTIADGVTFPAPGGASDQWVLQYTLVGNTTSTLGWFVRRIPDDFTAWIAGNVRVQYALLSTRTAANDYTLTMRVKNSSGVQVGLVQLTLAGDTSDTELKNTLVCDLSGSGIGAGDTIQVRLELARGGTGIGGTLYLGDLRFNWS